MRALRVFLLASLLLAGCGGLAPGPAPACTGEPDPDQILEEAWRAYQPDRPQPPSVALRRRLFALQGLLLSAGMYGDPPADPATAYAQYAPQFVRDLGAARNPAMAEALGRLTAALERARGRSDADLGDNCGLVLARRSLRAAPVDVGTDWVVQTATWGFAPYFQASVRQLVHEQALACGAAPEVASAGEMILPCLLRRVGL